MISQSNYIPWKGYFDSMNKVDEVVFLETVQFTRRDWRNRNQIKSASGPLWLTIPVQVTGKYHQLIHETRIADPRWGDKHWKTITHCYSKAKFFAEYCSPFESLYLKPPSEMLSEINRAFIQTINSLLGIQTKIEVSTDFAMDQLHSDKEGFTLPDDRKSQRLLNLCIEIGATEYWSGPNAKNYLNKELFLKAGIEVHYFDYSNYPPYPQLYGQFIHPLSILDLIFNTGPDAYRYMKSF